MTGWQAVFWHWWAFGALLLVIELLVPGMFFLWMAEAAFVTGLVLWIQPALSWEVQIVWFSLLSLFSILVARKILARHPIATDRPLLNRRAAQYVGRTVVLSDPIINGTGRIRVDDTTWKISGPDTAAGARVKVIGAEGAILEVEVTGE
jgi:inner membrane protein